MLKILLSYAHADGIQAAIGLRHELAPFGFFIWRDSEQLRGGQPWKEQMRTVLREIDVLVALLTPGYVASSKCAWEWETALTLDKRVIPLLIEPCDAPAELLDLQPHNLSTEAIYSLGLVKLVRDLVELIPAQRETPPTAASGAKYSIVGNRNKIIGEEAIVVQVSGGNAQALLTAILPALAQLRTKAGPNQVEFDAILHEISTGLGAVEQGVAGVQVELQAVRQDVQALRQQILARFDRQQQEVVAPILARMDQHHLAEIDAILEAMETTAIAADELDRLLAAIIETLATILAQQRTLLDQALQQSIRQVVEAAANETLDRRHRLKLTLPIIPALLAYEAEIEVGAQSRLASLWQSLTNLFH